MPPEQGVVDSPTKKDVADSSSKQTAEQLQQEIERKQAKLKELEGSIGDKESLATELQAIRAEIAKREEKGQDTTKLENQEEDLELQIQGLRKKPENRAFFSEFDRKIKNAEERGSLTALIAIQKEMVEDWAETEKVDLKTFQKELTRFADQDEESPTRKAKKAYKAWKEFRDYQKDKEELKKKLAKEGISDEDGTRKARETTLEDAVKSKDFTAQKKLLGL